MASSALNSVPQPAWTTFAFPSVRFFFYVVGLQAFAAWQAGLGKKPNFWLGRESQRQPRPQEHEGRLGCTGMRGVRISIRAGWASIPVLYSTHAQCRSVEVIKLLCSVCIPDRPPVWGWGSLAHTAGPESSLGSRCPPQRWPVHLQGWPCITQWIVSLGYVRTFFII